MGILTAIVAVVAIVAGALLAARARKAKAPSQGPQGFDENSLPTASESMTIPLVFGTREIKQSNVVNYGEFHNEEVEY